jgi:predicted transglutaminase-like cysteine proteinase
MHTIHRCIHAPLNARPLTMPPKTSTTRSPRALSESFLRRLVIVLACGLFTLCALAALDPLALRQQLTARFGPARVVLFNDWLQTIQAAKTQNDEVRLKRINDFVNRNIVFEDDFSIWQQTDYWATPLETIGQGRGDCEDFAIFKYLSLRLAGIPDSKLRLIYVKARLNTANGPIQQAHMVLAYYPSPTAEPLVLDNLDASIRPASRRKDLLPVFSFNSSAIFAGVSGADKASSGGIGRLSRWEDLIQRARREGFE